MISKFFGIERNFDILKSECVYNTPPDETKNIDEALSAL